MDSQEHISHLIQKMEQASTSYFAESIFFNRSKTSKRLKADILLDLLKLVRDFSIETFQDIQPILTDTNKQDALLCKLTEIHGIGEATSRYFLMLSGNDQMVKPDTMILRFIRNALGKTVSPVEAVHLIQAASHCLSKSYPDMSPRRLDHLIWYWQRSQSTSNKTEKSACVAEQRRNLNRIHKSNNKSLTIPQKVQESMYRRYKPGDLLSSSQIKKDVHADHNDISQGSVMPPDYCCNKWNKDPGSGIYHIFFYEEAERKYRLLPRVDITKPGERGVCKG